MNKLPHQTIGDDGSNSHGSTLLLVSFLAGFLAVAARFFALLAKIRQKHGVQAKESQQEREEMQMQEGSLFSDANMPTIPVASYQVDFGVDG